MTSQKGAFLRTIIESLRSARREGRTYLRLRAGDLHTRVGGYPGPTHRMPVCCAAMRSAMRPGDRIVEQPPKGNGANLVVEYSLADRRDLDDDDDNIDATVFASEPRPLSEYAVFVPPPMPLTSGTISAGARLVLYDYVLMGEVVGELVEFRRGPLPMWRIRVSSDGGTSQAVFVNSRGSSHLGRWHVVRTATHPVDRFFDLAANITPYPPGTQPVPARITGTAFFPGGSGLWRATVERDLPAFPVRGLMVLGQDFHSHTKYRQSAARGQEDLNDATWRELLRLLNDMSVKEHDCYFTNAFAGLRTDGSVIGDYPGARDEEFVNQCRSLLAEQIAAQRPAAILTLGLPAARMLASLAPTSLKRWLNAKSFADIDPIGGVAMSVGFPDIPDVVTSAVALIHPSMRNSNIDRRTYSDRSGTTHKGAAAERAMLAAVLPASKQRSVAHPTEAVHG